MPRLSNIFRPFRRSLFKSTFFNSQLSYLLFTCTLARQLNQFHRPQPFCPAISTISTFPMSTVPDTSNTNNQDDSNISTNANVDDEKQSNAVVSKRQSVIKQFCSITVSEGAGFLANRPIGAGDNWLSDTECDPFLLLDELPWTYYNIGEFPGAPTHPHRGFDTVMYVKHGEGRHEDSMGNRGILKNGDVQWMTAGSGIIHDEGRDHPGGILHGFQLWVNLPQKNKMDDPAYQQISGTKFPFVQVADGVKVKTIVGRIPGQYESKVTENDNESPISPKATVNYFDYDIAPGKKFVHKLTKEEAETLDTVIIYIYNGAGYFSNGGQEGEERNGSNESEQEWVYGQEKDRTIDTWKYKMPPNTLLFDGKGDTIEFEAIDENNNKLLNEIILDTKGKNSGKNATLPNPPKSNHLQFLLLMGKKLKEPIARRGPFVMNTMDEIYQCFMDFRAGKLVKKKGKASMF